MLKWIRTASPGVRFREHPTRKHGILPDRYFSIYYKIDGKQIEEGLGWASEGWGQKKAEEVRNDLKKSAKAGGPRTLKERRTIAKTAAAATKTVSDAVDEFWQKELRLKKSGTETKRLLDKDVLPAWGKRSVKEIKRRDIVLLLDEINDRGAPITRNRVHGALTRFLNFCAERGMIEDSPCTRIRKVPEGGRSRVLSDDEIKLLWAALDMDNKEVDIYRVSKLALKMILLTGQRPGEVCGMPWTEIDEESATWTIPPPRLKSNKEEHTVPLCGMAMDIIEKAKPFSGDSPYVFKSSHVKDEAKPITTRSLSRAILRHWKEMGLKKPFTPHDLRRTLRTRLAELGVPDFLGERILGHKLQGVMAVYNRHRYDQEKRQALDLWERRLRRIVGLEPLERQGKIIALR